MIICVTASYGGKKVGRIKENGKLYDEPYGGTAIGRTDHQEGTGYRL